MVAIEVASVASLVTAVLVTYDSARVIGKALERLPADVDTIVVDNGSSDDTVTRVRRDFPRVRCIELDRNVGFGRANNAALEQVETPFALLLNPDCVADSEMLAGLVEAAQRYPNAALLAPRLYDAPGRIGLCYRPRFDQPQPREIKDPEGDVCTEFLTGAAMMLRMSVFREVGFFDPWIFLYMEDDDLCLRVRAAGYSLVLVHDATVVHHAKHSSPPSLKLTYRRAYCLSASKLYILHKHKGVDAGRRKRWAMLLSAPLQLLISVLSFNRERAARSLARWVACWRFPRLVRQPHCMMDAD